jgi:hypothetical protein
VTQLGTSDEPPQPTRNLTPIEVVVIARSDRFSELLGVRESDQVDFKSGSYDLDSKRGKRDLAADVASLANARGGVIVLGVGTAVHQSERVEVASEFVGIRPGSVNRDRYLKVLREHVAPLVRDVSVDVIDSQTSSERKHLFGLITVGAQYEHDKPFIVERIVGDGEETVSHAVGWPERSFDSTYWHPLPRIQQLIAAGLRAGSLGHENADRDVDEEVKVADEVAEVAADTPSLVVQLASVRNERSIPDFFGLLAGELRQWRPIRAAGFGFDTSWHQPSPRGNRLLATDLGSAWLLSRSGVLTVVARLDYRNFTWALPPSESHLLINAAALTEWITESLRTAYEFVGSRLQPSGWSIRVIARNLLGDPPVAISMPRRLWPNQVWAATASSAEITMDSMVDWEADAFSLLIEVYGQCFGRGEASVFGANLETRRIDLRSFDTLK